jgi:hypothetical protein
LQTAHSVTGEEYDGDDDAVSRRLRLAIGGLTALVIAGALVAPVVLSVGESSVPCSTSLSYLGRPYAVRSVGGGKVVQAVSIGVGITRGCNSKPENVNVRSLVGIPSASAVGLEGNTTVVYVRRGVCGNAAAQALMACLTR